MATLAHRLRNALFAGPRPARIVAVYRLRPVAAIKAAIAALLAFLIVYYGGLGLMPPSYAGYADYHPVSAWNDRFDLAPFFGTFLSPPWPTSFTWWLGFALLCGGLLAFSLAYAFALAWAVAPSHASFGVGWGIVLFVVTGLTVWVAPGFHPALMRAALPDPGFFLLGWSGWATAHLLIACVVYGAVLGKVYEGRVSGIGRRVS